MNDNARMTVNSTDVSSGSAPALLPSYQLYYYRLNSSSSFCSHYIREPLLLPIPLPHSSCSSFTTTTPSTAYDHDEDCYATLRVDWALKVQVWFDLVSSPLPKFPDPLLQ